jgi:hypothetical protein
MSRAHRCNRPWRLPLRIAIEHQRVLGYEL